MFQVFHAKTADDAWRQIAEVFKEGASHSLQAGRTGPTNEVLHAAITIMNPRERWVLSRRPALNVAFALAEVIWILRGRNDAAFLNFFNRNLPRYAGVGETYHGAYGYRLKKAFGFDQLERAYSALKHNPETRQVALQIWNPSSDLPPMDGVPVESDVPCNMLSLLKVRAGRLEWLQVMRSNDVFRGLPYNLVQFTTLQEIIAGWLGVQVGEYHHLSDSLHLYETDRDIVEVTPDVQPGTNRDDLALSKEMSDIVFERLENIVVTATDVSTDPERLVSLCNDAELPVGYRNIACIICAEAARRRSREDLMRRLFAGCASGLFSQLYGAWLSRIVRRPAQSPETPAKVSAALRR